VLQNQRRTGPKLRRISSLSLSFNLGRCSGFLSSGPLTRDYPDLSSLLSRAPCPGQDGLNCRGTATRSSEVVSADVARHQPSVRFLCGRVRCRVEEKKAARELVAPVRPSRFRQKFLLCPAHVNVATQITEFERFEALALQGIKHIEEFV
jgi:hypothetical protein